MSVERGLQRLRVRWGLVPAGALRRWMRLAAYARGQVPGRYEEVLRDGWSEEWPLVLLRRADGVTRLLDGRHRLRTAEPDLWVPVVWLCAVRSGNFSLGRKWEGPSAVGRGCARGKVGRCEGNGGVVEIGLDGEGGVNGVAL